MINEKHEDLSANSIMTRQSCLTYKTTMTTMTTNGLREDLINQFYNKMDMSSNTNKYPELMQKMIARAKQEGIN